MPFFLLLLSLGITGLLLLIQAILFAPEGEEDSEGFHLTVPREPSNAAPAPSALTPADLVFFN